MNPFHYGQIVKDQSFCRRPKLVRALGDNIKRGQNVYIQGERRIGKTSLIFEAVRKLKKFRMIYVDLLEAKSSDDVLKRILLAIMSMEKQAGFLERVFKKLSHIRPVASVDPVTGLPTLTIDASAELKPDSIPAVLDLIASFHSKSRPVVVVFDEFQDVLNLKDARQTLALLRSKVQLQSEIAYVFAGSIRNKMDGIFTDPDSAFFKAALPIQVGPLDKETFRKFIIDKFESGKRRVAPETLESVFDLCFQIPGDIQQLCSALWDTTSSGKMISEEQIPGALELIFSHELKGYETILNIISRQQLKLLTALARMGGKAPMSSEFLKHSGIPQASSIRRALGRLVDLKILFHYENEYRFINPFLRAWLLHKKL